MFTFRFWYQTDQQNKIAQNPEINPVLWRQRIYHSNRYMLCSYIYNVKTLREAYDLLTVAVGLWNTDAAAEAPFPYSELSDVMKVGKIEFTPHFITLFMNSFTKYFIKRRIPRYPLIGDVLENVQGYGYMIHTIPSKKHQGKAIHIFPTSEEYTLFNEELQ